MGGYYNLKNFSTAKPDGEANLQMGGYYN